jgi:hypothetical protein
MVECKLRELGQFSNVLDFGIELFFLLRFDDVFFIVGCENNSREVVSILRPRECIEQKVVGIIDDAVLWIFGEFGLQGFEKCGSKFGVLVDLEVSLVSAEYLNAVL